MKKSVLVCFRARLDSDARASFARESFAKGIICKGIICKGIPGPRWPQVGIKQNGDVGKHACEK